MSRCSIGLLIARYLKIQSSRKNRLPPMSAFTEKTYLSAVFSKSILITAYQTFLFVSDNIKLGRACSSDVYSVLKKKS